MAYFKKSDSSGTEGKKEKKPRFDVFPKADSSEGKKPAKKKPFGKGGEFYEKKKRKPLGEDELPASRGFYKSKTGYNSPSAPWNREKAPTKKWDIERAPVRVWEEKKTPAARGPLKTFTKKGALKDPTQEVEHENDPANYGPAKLQFRRVSKRAQRSFSKNKERAYEDGKPQVNTDAPKSRTAPRPVAPIGGVEEKKKFMHGKGRPVKKGESRGELTERTEKPKAKNKPNPKPFKAAMPSNWRKVGE